MAVGTDSFLHLARPLAPSAIGVQPTTAPLNVIIQPQVRPGTRNYRMVS
jgi:translation initiation factor 3 subunit F